jgi:DNA-binding LacI/PurR family transcriptional regulator
MPVPVTQKALAAATGLSCATVCLALKDSPLIAAPTRARVRAAAGRLGYRRDPMMAALSAYRHAQRPRAFHGVLAWLASSAEGLDWRIVPEFRAYHDSAVVRARELGYQLERFDLRGYDGSPGQLARIFRNRGIRGALVCPMPQAHFTLRLPLEELAVLLFGYTLEQPALHRIVAHHYASMREIITRLQAHGYRRIGYAILANHNERLAGLYLAAFLQWQQRVAVRDRLPPLETDHATTLQPWLEAHQPDAVITSRHCFGKWPAELQAAVPGRLGVAVVSVLDGRSTLSGIDECSDEIGRTSVQVVTGMVERGETGLPAVPQCLLVQSKWHAGGSIRTQ